MTAVDPYQLRSADITEPPRSIGAALRRIGPGMILAASIVGSGELIATTTLGAQVGYVALWVILLSCIAKPVIQAEMGRYTIATGETALEAFDREPAIRAFFGEEFVSAYSTMRSYELSRFADWVTDWERREYLELF